MRAIEQDTKIIGWPGWFGVARTRRYPLGVGQLFSALVTEFHSLALWMPGLTICFERHWSRYDLVITLFLRRELTLHNCWRPARWEGFGGKSWYFLPVNGSQS